MKIVHVVPHIDQEASGVTYVLPWLCQSLATRGHQVEVSCLAAGDNIPGVTLDLHPQWPVLRRFAISTSHPFALRRKALSVDIIHNHSLWSMVNVAAGWAVPGKRAKLVVSPHGTLSPWALNRSRFVKSIMWPLQRQILARADLLHATSEGEYQEIRNLGFTAPVAIIPNGIDLPVLPAAKKAAEVDTLLFLSRIHPKKGLDRLLHAWNELQVRHPSWRLVIAGQGERDHVHEAEALATSLKLERVEFPGPLYGAAKSFVLPTHSENFGMVVAEALAHACPVVVSRGAPWAAAESEGCGWWVYNDIPSLTEALDKAMRLSAEQRENMGSAGRDWMQREYSWSSVAERMESAYAWVLQGGTPPDFVLESR